MQTATTNNQRQPSVVASVRALVPHRPLRFAEAQRVAEMQAMRLLQLLNCRAGPVPTDLIASLPRIEVHTTATLLASGATTWQGGKWRIQLNADEPDTRRRFTLSHELKHVLDASVEDVVYAHLAAGPARERHIEAICDHFAASLLMPRPWLKRVWGSGVQDLAELAWFFDVSQQAMLIRLQVVGLVERIPRCSEAFRLGHIAVRSTPTRNRWHRQRATTWPTLQVSPASRPLVGQLARRSP
jgi:predicted transcriptional regulator